MSAMLVTLLCDVGPFAGALRLVRWLRRMSRSRVCERLPEHPREQDCVTRPLPFPTFQTSVPLRSQPSLSKSLFWNILPITITGSIFCMEFLPKSLISGRAGRGEGVPVAKEKQKQVPRLRRPRAGRLRSG